MKTIFKGVATALYTPITDGKIDYEALAEATEKQIDAGIDAIVYIGTTGEAPTIDESERKQIVKHAVKTAKKRTKVIIGCGSNSTATARRYTEQAASLGADGALVVTPYYNKCTPYGAIEHYREICKERFPLIAYNVPKRTGVSLDVKTETQIASLDFVYGIKEANDDPRHCKELLDAANEKFAVYSGTDKLNGLFYRRGGIGSISVTSNIIPYKIKDIYNDFKNYYAEDGHPLCEPLIKLESALFSGLNPIPLKAMLKLLGEKGTELRLPLTQATNEEYEYFSDILQKLYLFIKETR